LAYETVGVTGPSDITHVIQLAIAPVFLLTAVGTTLNVLVNRLARIVDRGRSLEERALDERSRPSVQRELQLLEKRARFVYAAITLGVVSALFVSLLIAAAFAGYVLKLIYAWVMVCLFLSAMLSYTGALICLLGEVFLAIRSFRLGLAPDLTSAK
jgi:Protein of unknown function (DUF2721)